MKKTNGDWNHLRFILPAAGIDRRDFSFTHTSFYDPLPNVHSGKAFYDFLRANFSLILTKTQTLNSLGHGTTFLNTLI